jgi:hypothetical protein
MYGLADRIDYVGTYKKKEWKKELLKRGKEK